MQIMAVIDPEEVIFVDSLAYAVQDGEGGKVICMAWVFCPDAGRNDLSAPAPIELRYYREDARHLHGRLVGALQQDLDLLATRQREHDRAQRSGRVVALRG